MINITLTVNSKKHHIDLQGHETLLEILRDHLKLTGTKTACVEAECGACTVYVDGRSILSCITLAADMDNKFVTTIEGLAQGDILHPIQVAFLEKGAVQCGFCTPGMIMAAKDILDHNPNPTREEIREGLNGNICRCAGYIKITDAVEYAAQLIQEQKNNSND